MRVSTIGVRAAAIVLALGLTWAAVSESAAYVLAFRRPAIALAFRPNNPDALNAHNRSVIGKPAAKAQIGESLARAPLDSDLLAQMAADTQARDLAASDRLMHMISARTRRSAVAEQWIYTSALQKGDYDTAFAALDSLLRQQLMAYDLLYPDLEAALHDPAAQAAFARQLAASPDYRRTLIGDWWPKLRDPDVMVGLFAAMTRVGAPPNADETASLARIFVAQGDYHHAAQIAGVAGNTLVDGDFERSSVPTPFNWALTSTGQFMVDIAAAPNGRQGLEVGWPGNQTIALTQQFVLLSPGAYRLGGVVMVEKINNGAWLSWQAICAPTGAALGEARETQAGGWHDFSMTFTVPASCPAVMLRLQSLAGDGDDWSSAWYEHFDLTPVSDTKGL